MNRSLLKGWPAILVTAAACVMIVGTMANLNSLRSQPAAPDTNYSISVTAAELQVIGQALAERPYREVANLIGKLQQQMVAAQRDETKKKAMPALPVPNAK